VGAAIAAGNQAENGICALFVIEATIINKITRTEEVDSNRFHEFAFNKMAILRIIQVSPIRFDRTVIMPALNDLAF
jgi:hypothetical protein